MHDDSRAILRRIPLFRDFPDQDCDAVLSVLRLRQFPSGEVVFEQGAMGDTMVILLDGRLRVELTDEHGKKAELGAIGQGEIVGEMAVLDPAPRAASVIAASDAVVYELNRAGLHRLRVSAPQASAAIVSAIIGDVTRRLRSANQRVDRLLNPQAPAKTAPREEPAQVSVFSRIWSRLTGD